MVVGGLALIRPQVLSSGHSSLYAELPGQFALEQLALLAVLKGLASAISIGAGFRGGLFFASLFLGALVGKFFYGVLVLTIVVRTLPEPAYAVIGMCCVAVAIVGGPLTMAFLALESTGSLPLTVAALAAAVVSSLTVRRTFGYSFATGRFHLRGEAIRSAVDVGWMRNLTAGRMMSREFSSVHADSDPAELRRQFALGSIQRVVVLDQQDRYAGMFLVQDLQILGSDVASVSEFLRQQPEVLLPQMPINEIMARFQSTETDALAVVDDLESMHVVGVLTEQFALRRYSEALDRQRRVLSGE
jgi:chloride channel protein, CIC family